MRNFFLSFLLAVPLAAIAAPMTNDDVIKMVKGGLGEATVIQAIDAAEAGFDTSPDGLVKLKQGGVSDNVIQRIIARKDAAPGAAPAAAAASVCLDCGTITSIREIAKKGEASGVGAVHFRNHHRGRSQAEQLDDGQVLQGLRHGTVVGGDDDQRVMDAGDTGHHGMHEAFMARHVNEADHPAVPEITVGEAELDAHAARFFFRQSIGIDAGQRADQRGLAVIDVADRRDYHGRRGRLAPVIMRAVSFIVPVSAPGPLPPSPAARPSSKESPLPGSRDPPCRRAPATNKSGLPVPLRPPRP